MTICSSISASPGRSPRWPTALSTATGDWPPGSCSTPPARPGSRTVRRSAPGAKWPETSLPGARAASGSVDSMADSITITDNRTGDSVEIPIVDGGVSADPWRKLLPNIWFHDEALMTTAMTTSAITFLDGDVGILRYRGYPIEQLAAQSTYLEVAYLLINGGLPTAEELDKWTNDIRYHTYIHENFRKRFVDAFHYDAHPMGMLISGIAALSTYYPEAKQIEDPEVRRKQIVRLIAKVPTIAALFHRYSLGM